MSTLRQLIEVEPGEGRVLDHVLLREDHHVAERLLHAVGAVGGILDEELGQPFRRHVGGDVGGVDAHARGVDRPPIDIGGEELHRDALLQRLEALLQQDGDRVRLFAGGAAGHPDAHHAPRRPAVEDVGDDLFFEGLEGVGVAKEAGDANQQVAQQRVGLGRHLLQIAHVVGQRFNLMHRHAPLDAADHRALLVPREVVAGVGTQQHEDALHRAFGVLRRRRRHGVRAAEPPRGEIHEHRGHLGRRQHVVDQAGGDHAARHAVVLGRLRRLRHDHAAFALDRARAERAVAARAREHDANRALVLILRQGAEEEIDWQPQSPWRRRLEQVERAVQHRHVAVGRE